MVTKKLNQVLKKLIVHVARHDDMLTGPGAAATRALSFSSSEFSQSLGSETSVNVDVDVDGDDEECGGFEVPKDVPAGSLPVYVGQERQRFVIPTRYLSNNIFRALLAKSKDEFGLRCDGGLRIACTPDVFQHFLWWLEWEASQATRCSDDDNLVHLSSSKSGSSGCLVLDT